MKELSIKEVQERILDIAKSVKDILEKNNIPYFITYGTLLGAVRHKGFIPWDDDFDFFLFEDTYDEAMEVLRKQLPEKYFVEDEKTEPLYFHGWNCVKEHGTDAVFRNPNGNVYSHRGLSIDLFKACLRPENMEKAFHIDQHMEYLKRKYSKGLMEKSEYEERMDGLMKEKDNLPKNTIPSDKLVYMYPDIYGDKIFPEELFPLQQYKFEDTEFLGPKNADVFLRRCYGEYMEIPPVDKRVSHYKNVFVLD